MLHKQGTEGLDPGLWSHQRCFIRHLLSCTRSSLDVYWNPITNRPLRWVQLTGLVVGKDDSVKYTRFLGMSFALNGTFQSYYIMSLNTLSF
jgi:hypothetical protein